jgi:hypothetical protein
LSFSAFSVQAHFDDASVVVISLTTESKTNHQAKIMKRDTMLKKLSTLLLAASLVAATTAAYSMGGGSGSGGGGAAAGRSAGGGGMSPHGYSNTTGQAQPTQTQRKVR